MRIGVAAKMRKWKEDKNGPSLWVCMLWSSGLSISKRNTFHVWCSRNNADLSQYHGNKRPSNGISHSSFRLFYAFRIKKMNQNIHARLISGLDCCLRCIFSSTEIAIRIPQTEQEIVIKMYWWPLLRTLVTRNYFRFNPICLLIR